MEKKKKWKDLMEEDLMNTIQHRINELTAALKLLNASRPLCELLRRDLEREQERFRRESLRSFKKPESRFGRALFWT